MMSGADGRASALRDAYSDATENVTPAAIDSRSAHLLIPSSLHAPLLDWYARHQRDLPWRRDPSPYRVLVSEFMLQQTQAERVAPRYLAFLEQFPDIPTLARAATADVLRAWSGLGYNRRALHLQGIARKVAAGGGALPNDPDALVRLPGVGRYTAAALACFAFGRQVATVDTNIRRVLQRLFLGGDGARRPTEAEAWGLATAALPVGRAVDWNQALMDLGATICAARDPACQACPLEALCKARQEQLRDGVPVEAARGTRPRDRAGAATPFVGSTRYFRGRIVRALIDAPPTEALSLAALGPRVKEDYAPYDAAWLGDLVDRLARDGLLSVERQDGELRVRLPEDTAAAE